MVLRIVFSAFLYVARIIHTTFFYAEVELDEVTRRARLRYLPLAVNMRVDTISEVETLPDEDEENE